MKISICTTTARRGFVEYQAKMIANQTYRDIEWILVDFAYEERKTLVETLAKQLRLFITHLPNVRDEQKFVRDITRNRNLCLRAATGDAVIFLDDYACIPENFVENHIPYLSNNRISAGKMYRLERSTDDEVLKIGSNANALLRAYPDNIGKDYRVRPNGEDYRASGITYTGNLAIPRTIFETLNGFDPRMESGLEDCDFGCRASIAKFDTYFNHKAFTINLATGGIPYTFSFDHAHDVEPFISNPNNNFRGNALLEENEYMKVEFHEYYRIAICKICGARTMIDPNEVIHWNMNNNNFKVPEGLKGGYN